MAVSTIGKIEIHPASAVTLSLGIVTLPFLPLPETGLFAH